MPPTSQKDLTPIARVVRKQDTRADKRLWSWRIESRLTQNHSAGFAGLIFETGKRAPSKIFVLFVLGLLALARPTSAAIPPAEELLPADTLFVFTVPDFATLETAAHQSPQWLFWNDPTMQPFRDKFVTKWKESFVKPLEKDLGIKLADFADLPRGQLTFAVTRKDWNGSEGQSPGLLMLLDARDKGELLKTNLAALQRKWMNDGKPIRTETIRGISFSIVQVSSNDVPSVLSKIFPRRPPVRELGREPKPEKPGELVIGRFESLLIAGNSIESVAPVVAHLTGSSMPSLNDNAMFAADKPARFHDAPLYFGWFNAKTFFTILANATSEPPNPQAPAVFPQPEWARILAAAGFTGMNSISFADRQTRDGTLVDIYIAAPDAARTGIVKIVAPRPKSASPPVFVPADAIRFWRMRLDGQQSWSELQKMADDISPGILKTLDTLIDAANDTGRQNNPGFDVRQYLFENLGDDFIRYEKPSPGNAPSPDGGPSLFLFAVHDGDRAVAALQTIMTFAARSAQKPPEPRSFQGHKIIALPVPSPRNVRGPVPQRLVYCAASEGYVALSTDVSMLEEHLRSAGNPPKPLSGAPGLIEAAQQVGGAGTGWFGYQNQHETMRLLFTMLKKAGNNRPVLAPTLPKTVNDWMDFSLLPDYNRVSKYFYFSVYSGSATTDGMALRFFSPRPPRLNQ
jgi:hypothetical protein